MGAAEDVPPAAGGAPSATPGHSRTRSRAGSWRPAPLRVSGGPPPPPGVASAAGAEVASGSAAANVDTGPNSAMELGSHSPPPRVPPSAMSARASLGAAGPGASVAGRPRSSSNTRRATIGTASDDDQLSPMPSAVSFAPDTAPAATAPVRQRSTGAPSAGVSPSKRKSSGADLPPTATATPSATAAAAAVPIPVPSPKPTSAIRDRRSAPVKYPSLTGAGAAAARRGGAGWFA